MPPKLAPVLTIALGFLGGILISIIPGSVNGRLVAKMKVPPFIATLGMGYVVYGVALLMARGIQSPNSHHYLGPIGNGSIMYYWPGHGF